MHAKEAIQDGALKSVVDGAAELEKRYEKGDIILCGIDGSGHYAMGALDFAFRYERPRPEPALLPDLDHEGFSLYTPTGKTWAFQLSEEDVSRDFPFGQFIASWGSPISIGPHDYLAMPFPAGGELYRIKQNDFESSYAQHIIDGYVPTQAEAIAEWSVALQKEGRVYCKTTKVHAKLVTKDGEVETVVNGVTESPESYSKGDFMVQGKTGERYSMTARDFEIRYERSRPEPASDASLAEEGFYLYRPIGKVWACELTVVAITTHFPAGKFIASWNSPVTVEAGDFLAMPFPAGGELYRIEKGLFFASYSLDASFNSAGGLRAKPTRISRRRKSQAHLTHDADSAKRRLMSIAVRLSKRPVLEAARADVTARLDSLEKGSCGARATPFSPYGANSRTIGQLGS